MFVRNLNCCRKKAGKNLGLNVDRIHDLCGTSAVLSVTTELSIKATEGW